MPAKPRKRPCSSCPYRLDVPSGVWAESEYSKLPDYDRPTGQQPMQVFMCHQADGTVCSGWAAVHGDRDNLALRMAASLGADIDRDAVIAYTTDVPLFSTGMDAALHGIADIEEPGPMARAVVAKLMEQRDRRRALLKAAIDMEAWGRR